jgi:hypothetical protein
MGFLLFQTCRSTALLFLIPQKYIRENPVNWGYQAVIVSEVDGKKIIIDFLNQSAKTKEAVLSEKPFQSSAVRLRK